MIFNDLQCLSGATWKCLCVPGFGVEALPSTPLTPPWAISAVADDFDTCSAPASPFYSPAWRVAKSARRCSHPKDPRAVIPLEDLCCESKQHWRVRDALAFTPKALQGDVCPGALVEGHRSWTAGECAAGTSKAGAHLLGDLDRRCVF